MTYPAGNSGCISSLDKLIISLVFNIVGSEFLAGSKMVPMSAENCLSKSLNAS